MTEKTIEQPQTKLRPFAKKAEAPAAPPAPTEQIVAIITKQPPHSYSVTLSERGEKKTYKFNSKEAMCVFLGGRNL